VVNAKKCLTLSRTAQQVQERLDRLIGRIQEIQKPYLHGGSAPDVMVVCKTRITSSKMLTRCSRWPMAIFCELS
jgi:hypothetical protein